MQQTAKGLFSGASEANAIRGKLGTSIKDHTLSISKYNIDNLKYFPKYRVHSDTLTLTVELFRCQLCERRGWQIAWILIGYLEDCIVG